MVLNQRWSRRSTSKFHIVDGVEDKLDDEDEDERSRLIFDLYFEKETDLEHIDLINIENHEKGTNAH